MSGYTPSTVFSYDATSEVRDGGARAGVLDCSGLEGGRYVLRVVAEDYFGNAARVEVPVILATGQR
jgi:hypothetical protein